MPTRKVELQPEQRPVGNMRLQHTGSGTHDEKTPASPLSVQMGKGGGLASIREQREVWGGGRAGGGVSLRGFMIPMARLGRHTRWLWPCVNHILTAFNLLTSGSLECTAMRAGRKVKFIAEPLPSG